MRVYDNYHDDEDFAFEYSQLLQIIGLSSSLASSMSSTIGKLCRCVYKCDSYSLFHVDISTSLLSSPFVLSNSITPTAVLMLTSGILVV